MKARKLFALLLGVLLLLSLAACGASSNLSSGGDYYDRGNADLMEPEAGYVPKEEVNSTGSTALPQNQKLVQKVWLDAETEDMDALLRHIDQRIAGVGGYVEAQSIYHGSNYSGRKTRSADLTIRVPADQLDSFVAQLTDASNIVSSRKTTDNVTLSYVATESRLKALEVEQERLLDLLSKAADLKDLLTIEERLTEVRTELEQVTSQLRLYDNMVDYATIYLNISEVKEYTEPVEDPETMWERIAVGFSESMADLGQGLEDMVVFLVVSIPYLIPLAVIAVIVIVIVKLRKRKKTKKQPPESTPKA